MCGRLWVLVFLIGAAACSSPQIPMSDSNSGPGLRESAQLATDAPDSRASDNKVVQLSEQQPIRSPSAPDIAEQAPDPPPLALVDPGPVYERSAHAGDGIWRDFFFDSTASERMEREVPPDFDHDVGRRMVLHPHPTSRFQTLTLAAFDLAALRLAHVPGVQDVIDVNREDLKSLAGLVPASDQSALVAVFNGGFQPRHGRWGMLSLGQQLIPPRDDACTVAVTKDGTLLILPWSELQGLLEQIVAYRQTPPCLVMQGKIHPLLEIPKREKWAGQQASRQTRRRSVIGVSEDGRVLYFGMGSETEPETLARGAAHAGAHFAAQLDINWNWTRLFLFRAVPQANEESPGSEAVGALAPQMVKDKGEYISRRASRGFFYLRQR